MTQPFHHGLLIVFIAAAAMTVVAGTGLPHAQYDLTATTTFWTLRSVSLSWVSPNEGLLRR
jgi:hypothetical protein